MNANKVETRIITLSEKDFETFDQVLRLAKYRINEIRKDGTGYTIDFLKKTIPEIEDFIVELYEKLT